MKKIISVILAFMLITTMSFAGTFTKTSNGTSISINVDQGKTILLKAREIFGKIFTGWTITGTTVSDASLSEQTITMPSGDVTATANYAIPYTITVNQTANGVISPGNVTVAGGSNKTFTITPNTGHEIEDVLVDGVSVKSYLVAGTGDEKTYTMSGINGNRTITATYSSIGSGGGSIIPTISVASKTTNSITISTSATEPNGGNLVYKLYVNGNLKATSSEVPSGQSVSLTASGLKEYESYGLYVSILKNNVEVGISSTLLTKTMCSGSGAYVCSIANTEYWCYTDQRVPQTNGCSHTRLADCVGVRMTCGLHDGYIYLEHGASALSTGGNIVNLNSSYTSGTWSTDHCEHGLKVTHD